MTTTIDATPNSEQETVVYIIGNHVQELINSLDYDMSRLMSFDRQGEYVKVDKAFDVLIDVRNKLKGLIAT